MFSLIWSVVLVFVQECFLVNVKTVAFCEMSWAYFYFVRHSDDYICCILENVKRNCMRLVLNYFVIFIKMTFNCPWTWLSIFVKITKVRIPFCTGQCVFVDCFVNLPTKSFKYFVPIIVMQNTVRHGQKKVEPITKVKLFYLFANSFLKTTRTSMTG